jgi:hypothetical protein
VRLATIGRAIHAGQPDKPTKGLGQRHVSVFMKALALVRKLIKLDQAFSREAFCG